MTPSGSRNPRHRRSPNDGPPPMRVRAREGDGQTPAQRQLTDHPTCQWQARMVRCPAAAEAVVESRERVLRSSCVRHVPAWLRTGGRVVA